MKTIRLSLHLLLVPGLLALSGCAGAPSGQPEPVSPTQPGGGGEARPAAAQIVRSDQPRVDNPQVSQQDLAALSSGNAAFAFDLYRTLRGQEGNLFFSPYSISVALAMTYAGAVGDTASQMASAMHFDLAPDGLHPAFNAVSQALAAQPEQAPDGTPFELSIANSLWGQQDFGFQPAFLDLLAQNYGAGLRLVDFAADPEAARLAINDWVSDETRDKIRDLIPAGVLDALTRLVLANAIYFKASWLYPFAEEETASEPFYRLDGSAVDVPMMSQSESFGYGQGDGYAAIQLPYQGAEVSMLLILPDEGQFEAIESQLDASMIDTILGELSYGQVELSLPRWTNETSFELNTALQSLGMVDAFDGDRADFSGMTGARDLFIGAVLHKAFVAVDEVGTEAAAATVVVMKLTSAPIGEPFVFRADRPFLYLIHDGQTGSVLFLGRVLNPAG